jgi:hypothetical protein
VEVYDEPGTCKECPSDKANCLKDDETDTNTIGPKSGYWRSSNSSDNFIACLFKPACLGTYNPGDSPMGECLEGYQGILCADCAVGFSRTSGYECGFCPHPVANVFRLGAIMFVAVFVVIFLIKSTLAGAKERKNVTSIYSKILMNHL